MVLSNRQFIAGDFGRLDLNPQTTLTAGDTLAWSFNTMPLTLSVQAVTQRPEYAGQAGSALATGLAQLCSLIVFLIYFLKADWLHGFENRA